ncbi:MAG: hypothetical protein ACK4MR_12255 [Erythrobacter cryptus]
MPDLAHILAARTPLTLSSLPRGAAPLVLADLARAAHAGAHPEPQGFQDVSDESGSLELLEPEFRMLMDPPPPFNQLSLNLTCLFQHIFSSLSLWEYQRVAI